VEDRSRRRARLVLIVGILLAVLGGAGAFVLSSSSGSKVPIAPPVVTTGVVVAARDLPPRTALTAADIRVAQYPTDIAPATALAKAEDVVGKVAQQTITAGEPILPNKLGAAGVAWTVFPPNALPAPGQPIPAGTPDYRVWILTVPDGNAAGGVVQVGDYVDLMLTWTIDAGKFTGPADPNRLADVLTKITLQNIQILARAGAAYTIRTDAQTAEQLGYLQAAGVQMTFLLRQAQDQRTVVTQGGTFGPVYKRFNFPIPVKVTQ
jgi:Flp pilus assembly protein CpaB